MALGTMEEMSTRKRRRVEYEAMKHLTKEEQAKANEETSRI